MKKKKRRISFQKLFSIISAIFLLGCILFYGIRFIILYKENNVGTDEETTILAKRVKLDHATNDYFQNINSEYYFVGNTDHNYVTYANLTWRIIKINSQNSAILILNDPITSLAYSGDLSTYQDSSIYKWLNNDKERGFASLVNSNNYLTHNHTCTDQIKNTKNITCKQVDEESYVSLPTLEDYVNTGSSDSFINNGYYSYLANTAGDGKVWYIDSEGKIKSNDGTDIYGVKPVITLASNIEIIDGNGSKDEPYQTKTDNSYLGSYVKLDNDLWRVYQEQDKKVKLILTDYLQENDQKITRPYSSGNSYYNDTQQGSIAYYLNHNYYQSLAYHSHIEEVKWSNGYYSKDNNYDYEQSLDTTIDSKIALPSIGEINLVPHLDNYLLMTSPSKNSNNIYVYNKDGSIDTKKTTTKANVVPTISIDKELLTKGNGSQSEPYETEE